MEDSAPALSDVTDPQAHEQRSQEYDSQYGTKEEKRVIEKVETPAAKKAGEGTRTDHKATLVPVSDPTKQPTPPPVKKQP